MSTLKIKIPDKLGFLLSPKRYKVLYGGRGGAKSYSVALVLLALGVSTKIRVLCTRELQISIGDSVHRLLADIIAAHPHLSGHYQVLNNSIRGINGTEFIFKGLKHNITEIKGLEGIDYVWCEEAENISDRSWELLIPTIRKDGSEIWIVFNPRNPTDPTYRRFVSTKRDDAIVCKIGWQDNPWFPDVLRKEMEALKASDYEAYRHIWEGEFDTRYSGLIYATYLEKARQAGNICSVPHTPGVPVITAWDLGRSDATCITFAQVVGREPRIIDYHAATGSEADLTELARVLRDKPYDYAGHWLPHDGEHERQGMPGSITYQLRKMGLKIRGIPRGRKKQRIEAGRKLIAQAVFSGDKCSDLIHALMNYRYEYDEARKMFKPEPLHDWSSDPADSFGYLAQALETGDGFTAIKASKPISLNVGHSYMGMG